MLCASACRLLNCSIDVGVVALGAIFVEASERRERRFEEKHWFMQHFTKKIEMLFSIGSIDD